MVSKVVKVTFFLFLTFQHMVSVVHFYKRQNMILFLLSVIHFIQYSRIRAINNVQQKPVLDNY